MRKGCEFLELNRYYKKNVKNIICVCCYEIRRKKIILIFDLCVEDVIVCEM